MSQYRTILPLLMRASALALMAAPAIVTAQTEVRQDFDLPAQPLDAALRDVARIGHREIMMAQADVSGKMAPALTGRFTIAEAMAKLLVGTDLLLTEQDGAFLIARHRSVTVGGNDDAANIVVTGSRVRGAPPSSPVIRVTQEDIRAAGQSNLGDVARSLPQSSGGGQNPAVGLGAGQGNENTNGGSNFDLRGIGADATLTLLNGHRLSYAANNQSIDISVIPVAALDQIEILTDGASAIYGSDAVAGVVNIGLKRSFKGLETTARLGAATDGGDRQQQYSAVSGGDWGSGGILVSGDFERDTAIVARQRDYITSMAPETTVLPGQKRYNFLASGRQQITENLEFELDAFYNHRTSSVHYAFDLTSSPDTFGLLQNLKSRASAVAPRLSWNLGASWKFSASGVAATDQSDYRVRRAVGGAIISDYSGCYCNSARSLEANLEGPLFALPGGSARVALGAGYRYDRMHARRDAAFDFTTSRSSYFGYAEIFLPFVGAANAAPLVEQLSATAAIRYEDYGRNGDIATPKIGLLYAPSSSVRFRGSWGKSFKVPTFFQSGLPVATYLSDAVDAGCTNCAVGATVLQISGGNRNLKPERASTWSVGIDIHPESLKGLNVALSYFDISYKGRVALSIPGFSQSFNPLYTRFLDTDVTPKKLAATIAASSDFQNFSTQVYDPAAVVAIIETRFVNVARQWIHGIDLSARYSATLGDHTSAEFSASGSWLTSRQRLIEGGEETSLAGQIYNPPRLRVRGGASLKHRDLALGAFVSRTCGVNYKDGGAPRRLGSMTVLDATSRYVSDRASGLLGGIEIGLAVQNILNDKPSIFASNSPLTLPFDGTNYPAVGRFISLSFTKHW